MAKQTGNVVTHGLSGKIGNQLVFRQTKVGTVVSSVPQASGKVTENQKLHRRRFQRAVIYANAVVADEDQNAAYAAKAKAGQTARNVAIADFFHAPDIEVIDLSGYHGKPGDVIRIEVTDDFAVREVKALISNPDGSLVEEGYARQGTVGYEWTYTATTLNESLEGDRIEIYASDTPGNISKETAEID
jgi:hypothetical protein